MSLMDIATDKQQHDNKYGWMTGARIYGNIKSSSNDRRQLVWVQNLFGVVLDVFCNINIHIMTNNKDTETVTTYHNLPRMRWLVL